MARVPSHLIQRGGVYNYRRRVPSDLRNRPGFEGRAIFQVSLGIRTLAQARKRVLELGLDDLFKTANDTPQERDAGTIITTPLLRQIADENFRRGLEGLRRERDSRTEDGGGADADELAAQNIGLLNDPKSSDRTRAYMRRELTPVLTAQAEGIAARLGVEPTSAAIEKIASALFESEIGLEGARVDLAGGHAFPAWSAGGANGEKSETVPTAREAHWSFKKLADAAMRQQPKGASWEHKVTTVAALFDDYVGGIPVYRIDRRRVRDFLDDVRFMPKNMKQRFPDLSLTDAIAANRARENPYPSVAPNTAQNGYFSILRWVFNYALEREALIVNPCTGVKVKDAKKGMSRQKKTAFMIDELNALFRLPPFTGSLSAKRPNKPGNVFLDDHRKWAPLVMLFTGARTSEVAQLAVDDIRGDHAFPHISILTEYDPEDPDEDRDFVVSHKTANARRQVPIHPDLVALGFLRYVAARKEAGDVRLFPDWKLPADARKLYSSASWIRAVNEILIPSVTKRHPKPTLYSFRHTWKTQMAKSQVSPQFQNQILGHAQIGMDVSYLDSMDIETTYNAVKDVKYDGLNLTLLKRS